MKTLQEMCVSRSAIKIAVCTFARYLHESCRHVRREPGSFNVVTTTHTVSTLGIRASRLVCRPQQMQCALRYTKRQGRGYNAISD